jgi:hypothetical protein
MELKNLTDAIHQNRFREISFLRSYGEDNDLKVKYAEEVLDVCGTDFTVFSPPKKSNRMKSGSCYANAIEKMDAGYQYVEGVIIHKDSGQKISHAWNLDAKGRHIDFTIINTDEYLYRGIIIPEDILYAVGWKNGRIRYCCLPYLGVEV